MKISKKATSIIEAMVVMLVVVTGTVGMYNIYIESDRLSNSTKNKIKAIEIAREGIEAVTNIRDTNWIVFWSDYANCWNTLNYDSGCISDWVHNEILGGSWYVIYQNTNDADPNKYRWYLNRITGDDYEYKFSNDIYREDFKIWLDDEWFYTQTWIVNDLTPLFTREIIINFATSDKMFIKSLVQWKDNSWDVVHTVELENILTNWKNDD